jgi:hypothetical protein
LQNISSQKSFLWENENDHKKYYNPWVLHHHWFIWLWSHSMCMKVHNGSNISSTSFELFDLENVQYQLEYKLSINKLISDNNNIH